MVYTDPPVFSVSTVTVPQLNTLSDDIRYLKGETDKIPLLSSAATSAGNVGTGEDDLLSSVLPGGTLGTNGMGVRITAGGRLANNANAKTIKVYFGATAIFSLGFSAAPGADYAWRIVAEVIRTGASAQLAFATFVGAVPNDNAGDRATQRATPGANLASDVTIKMTGTATDTNDVQQDYLTVERL